MSRPPSTLADVARLTGVSAMTVSRVLNNRGAVSAETRERVLHWVQALGFRKDRFASINARRRGGRRARPVVVVDAIAEAPEAQDSVDFYARISLAAVRRLAEADCEIVLTDLTRQPEQGLERIAEAEAMLWCTPLTDAVHRRVRALNPAIAEVTVCQIRDQASAIVPDDDAGGAMAAEAALAVGHRRAAVLTSSGQESFVRRSRAFAERFRAAGASVDLIEYPVLPDGIHVAAGEPANAIAAYWDRRVETPDVFFAVGGYATLILYRWLRDRRIAVPGAVGLIGYDALPFYDHLDTPISRIEFPVADLGRQAAEEVLRRLDPAADPAASRRTIGCRFVEGASLAVSSGTAGHAS